MPWNKKPDEPKQVTDQEPSELDTAYETWKKDPSPQNMGVTLQAANPVINSALQSYGKGNQVLKGRARILAAKAVQSYDPDKGTKLRTHMMNQMQPLIRSARQYSQPVHIPERAQADLYQVEEGHQRFFDDYGREPSENELADLTGLSIKRIAHVRKMRNTGMPESALTQLGAEGEEQFMPGMDHVDPEQIFIEYLHHDLDPIDQKILEWRTGLYGKPKLSNNEIAKKLGLSAGAISQRAAKISARLSAGMEASM
jgi:DNA-directed RNA polymerase specialized sigma subunit